MRIAVTGANGFVGTPLCAELLRSRHQVVAAVRSSAAASACAARSPQLIPAVIGDIGEKTEWTAALAGSDACIHLAARVHVMRDTAADPLAAFREVNTAGSLRLAEQAVQAGVKRFVMVSTVKVNGEASGARPFVESDPPSPADPYGLSKHEAELGLRSLAERTGLELVIVRPVLVYGPAVRGNFLRLLQWIDRGIPLPFAATGNRRSLLAVANLVSLLRLCAEHPRAAGQTFLAADGEDLSTGELIRRLATALDRPARLFPLPPSTVELVAKVPGLSGATRRLFGTLQVSCERAEQRLGWAPPMAVDQALRELAIWYRKEARPS
jgi:UDP-glucose 4-epimerase